MRLSEAALGADSDIARPGYRREDVRCGIVHLGAGAFHRAHQALYIDDLLATDPTWAITAVSLRGADTAAALNPQQGLYSVLERGPGAPSVRVIGSVLNVLVAPRQGRELLRALTDPAVAIVSLTITEKGYCHLPASGELDVRHEDIEHDLQGWHSGELPRSAIGWLVAALRDRRAADAGPFSVVSCDNLPANGKLVRRLVLQFARACDVSLAQWIDQRVTFPCTMVDRIVPATTSADRASVAELAGFEDAWPVVAEPFTQWVIEDDFCNRRPDLASVGAQLVDDVQPFELMKLRMLNGAHSTLAYLGFLAGHQSVAEAMAGPGFEEFLSQMMSDEIMPSLAMPAGIDLHAYRDALLRRFANPALRHRTAQIAMDGSQKLPQRLLATIADNLAHGRAIDKLALGVAGWMRYVAGVDERGGAIEVSDPLAAQLARAAGAGDAACVVSQLLKLEQIFTPALAANATFERQLVEALTQLRSEGAAALVRRYASA